MQPRDLPAVDDHAVTPETGTEMIHGEIRRALPADPPHAIRQCRIAYVIHSNVAPGYVASTELLTRVAEDSDFATDACIHKDGEDPETGSRYLEELSFEVKHTQSEADIRDRARMLARRGVRRIFVIPVKKGANGKAEAGPVREWLARDERWLDLHPNAEIADPCLVMPIKVQALLDATEADNQVARVLWARRNPALVEYVQAEVQKHSEAQARELRQAQAEAQEAKAEARAATLDLCEVLDIQVTAERRTRLLAMTSHELAALRRAIRAGRRWPQDI